jgi:hypothetical protein
MKQENKTSSITFRLSEEEKEKAEKKVEAAGYKTISAFVRDYVINETPREKIEISPKSFELLSALSRLSALVNSGTTRQDISKEIANISRIAMGS